MMATYSRPRICGDELIWSAQFSQWYPYYAGALTNRTTQCYQLLHDNPFSYSIVGRPGGYSLMACIQDGLPIENQLAMASAQVLLGLTPTLLSTLAPSVGEISMLSSVRPLLALLLSLGCPAVYSIRALEYDDPVLTLKPTVEDLFNQKHVPEPGWREVAISTSQ